MKFHGNSRKSSKPHHLYAIMDEEAKDVWKYGISGNEIDDDDLSERVRSQVRLYNAVAGWIRFFGKILVRNIPGRARALEIEEEYVAKYEKKHGMRPPGNREKS
ncbi:MAG: hypothetical protein AAF242_03835 [Bacteroidota bacterium]